MKNVVDGMASTLELDRRLKLGVDRLREARETMEELSRIADAIGPLLGVESRRGRARAAPEPRPAARAERGRPQVARTEARPPPAKASSHPPAPAASEELPEWRKVFPALSANVPGRSK